MLKLYSHPLSGNAYKVRLLLALLGLEHETINVAITKGEHRQPPFLKLNPFGQIPVLVDSGADGNADIVLADAQAILVYIARQYGNEQANHWLPIEPLALSRVMRWLSTTAGEVRQGPESARLYHLFKVSTIDIEQTQKKATFILGQLEQHLSTRAWLASDGQALPGGEHPTIADIAVFPYVALSADGKIDLAPYPHVLAWIDQIKNLPNFVSMRGL